MATYLHNTFSSYSPSGYRINRPWKRRGPRAAGSPTPLVWEDNLLVAQPRPDSIADVVSVGSVHPANSAFHLDTESLYGNWRESWDNTLP